MPDICDDRLALSGREIGVARSFGPLLPFPFDECIWFDNFPPDEMDDALLPLPIDELCCPDVCPLVDVVVVVLPLLPIDVFALIMPELIVFDGVFAAVDVFACVGDESAGDGVASGIDGMSDDIGVLGFIAFDASGPFDMRLGDGLGTGIIDDGLLLSIGVEGIAELLRPND